MKQNNRKLTRILCIDGGGIKGILPGKVLVALEQKLRYKTNQDVKVAEYFDFVAGTSTGGILTCALLTPDQRNPKRPEYSAEEAVDLYLKNGGKIFDIPTFHKVRTGDGLFDEKYPEAPIEAILEEYFRDTKLSELIRPCLISSYDMKRGQPHFFTQHDAIKSVQAGNRGKDYYVRDVSRATSAAPTYFEAADIQSLSDVSYPLIDGGIFANNPTLCAYAEARKLSFGVDKMKPSAKEMLIFSIGTGGTDKSYEFKDVKNWGVIQWIKPLINVMMDGVAKTVDYQLKAIFDAVDAPKQYIRINPILGDANSDMDDAAEKNLKALAAAGTETAELNDKVLDQLADMLIENH